MIKLSILIPSVHTRRNNFLPKIQDEVFRQIELLPNPNEVEVIVLTDNKQRMLGGKRNDLVNLSQGLYYVFIDDDDRIHQDYISDILEATKHNADVITLKADVTINGQETKVCIYSTKFNQDRNTATEYHRIPNHICAVKRDVGINVSFPSIAYGEDSGYSKLLKPLLKSEHFIDKVLYYYDYNQETTEAQSHLNTTKTQQRNGIPPIVDVVFLSNAKNSSYKAMTQKAIDTCIRGANGLSINVIVIEQNSNIRYSSATTLHSITSFNYNAFANYGASQGTAEWIMIANNDLVFTDGWLHALLSANHDLVSPKSPKDPRQIDILENEIGDVNGRNLSGWCFMINRELWQKIGKFDTCVNFWFSDDVTIEQCKKVGVLPMLVPTSIVHHLGSGSATLRASGKSDIDDYTWGQVDIFNTKYGKDKFINHEGYIQWKRRQTKLK